MITPSAYGSQTRKQFCIKYYNYGESKSSVNSGDINDCLGNISWSWDQKTLHGRDVTAKGASKETGLSTNGVAISFLVSSLLFSVLISGIWASFNKRGLFHGSLANICVGRGIQHLSVTLNKFSR